MDDSNEELKTQDERGQKQQNIKDLNAAKDVARRHEKRTKQSALESSSQKLSKSSDDTKDTFWSAFQLIMNWEPKPEPLLNVLKDLQKMLDAYCAAAVDPHTIKSCEKTGADVHSLSILCRNTTSWVIFPFLLYNRYFNRITNPMIEAEFYNLMCDVHRNVHSSDRFEVLIRRWAQSPGCWNDYEFSPEYKGFRKAFAANRPPPKGLRCEAPLFP